MEIAYADRLLGADIPERNIAFDLTANDAAALADVPGAIHAALAQPIGTPPLHQLVSAGQKVVVVADDFSRTTPTWLIVPAVLDELNRAGVPDTDVKLVVACGTHRKMTEAELDAKFGPQVLGRVRLLQHDCRDTANLISYGVTRRGTHIYVFNAVLQADVRIGIGSICPHFPTGWSGGAKIMLPGVAGETTVAQMHLVGADNPHLGGEAESPMREEMEDFARTVGLSFIVNTVHNRAEDVVAVFAGGFIAAHRAGVQCAQHVWNVPFHELADLTLASTSPIDQDLGQAGKGVLAAAICTREGGEIALISPCYEGYSPTHQAWGDYLAMPRAELRTLAYSGQAKDPVATAMGLNMWHAKARCRITAVSKEGITPAMAARIGFNLVPPEGFVGYVAGRLAAEPDLRIGILRHAAHVVPVLRK